MKILFHLKSLSIKGGAEKAALSLAAELNRRGHTVDISLCRDTAIAYPVPDDVKVLPLKPENGPKRSLSARLHPYQRPLQHLVETGNYDAVVGWLKYGGGMVGWLPKGRAVRILAMRNFPYNLDRKPSLPWKWPKHRHRQKGFASVDRYFVQMPQFVEMLPGAWRSRAHVIPNAVPPPHVDPVSYDSKPKLIVAVARLVRVKRLEALIEGFALFHGAHPDWRLEIWGDSKPERLSNRKELSAIIERRGLAQSVQLMGVTDDIEQVYARARIMAHPSQKEGMSNSIAEAMARGLAVIAASDCVGMDEMIRNGDTGILVDGGDGAEPLPEQICRALSKLADDDAYAANLGQRAQDHILSEFSAAAVYDRWESELQAAIDGHAGTCKSYERDVV